MNKLGMARKKIHRPFKRGATGPSFPFTILGIKRILNTGLQVRDWTDSPSKINNKKL